MAGVIFRLVNPRGHNEACQLSPTSQVITENKCTMCRYAIQGRWYRDRGGNYSICRFCVDNFVQPISTNQLRVDREFFNQYMNENVYNQMTTALYSDLRGVTCRLCGRENSRSPNKWSCVNTYQGNKYSFHIGCVRARVIGNQNDENLVFDTNPTWRAVARVTWATFTVVAPEVVPPPLNTALSIFLKLLAYKAYSARR